MTPDEVEQHMAECEARYWLRKGYNTKEKIEVLEERIRSKRGARGALRLIEEMRRQWQRRREWL